MGADRPKVDRTQPLVGADRPKVDRTQDQSRQDPATTVSLQLSAWSLLIHTHHTVMTQPLAGCPGSETEFCTHGHIGSWRQCKGSGFWR